MKTIHRYPLQPGLNKIQMPEVAQVLSAQSKDNEPQLWALVLDDDVGMTLVFHVFDVTRRR